MKLLFEIDKKNYDDNYKKYIKDFLAKSVL